MRRLEGLGFGCMIPTGFRVNDSNRVPSKGLLGSVGVRGCGFRVQGLWIQGLPV